MIGHRSMMKQYRNVRVHAKMAPTSEKVCMQCKYFRPDVSYYDMHDRFQNGSCTHQNATSTDIITGTKYFKYAYTMRNRQNLCGTYAKYFEKEHPLLVNARYIHILPLRFIVEMFIYCFVIVFLCLCIRYCVS